MARGFTFGLLPTVLALLVGGCAARLPLPFEMEVGAHYQATVIREQGFSRAQAEIWRHRAEVPLRIRVLEETATGFLLDWYYGCLDRAGAVTRSALQNHYAAGAATGLILVEGLNLRILTDSLGRPVKLENLFQIRRSVLARLAALRARVGQEDGAATGPGRLGTDLEALDHFYTMAANRRVEAVLLADAQLLATFNGRDLPLEGPEVFGPLDPAPQGASGEIAVSRLDRVQDRAWVKWRATRESDAEKRRLAAFWPAARPAEASELDTRAFAVFEIDLATGLTRAARLEQSTDREEERLRQVTRIRQRPGLSGPAPAATCRRQPTARLEYPARLAQIMELEEARGGSKDDPQL